MKFKKIKLGFFGAALLFTICLESIFVSAFAEDDVENAPVVNADPCEMANLDEKLLKAAISWIKKHGKVPTALELSESTDYSARDVLLKIRAFSGVAGNNETNETVLVDRFVQTLRRLYRADFEDFHAKLLQVAGAFLKRHLRTPSQKELSEVLSSASGRDLDLIYGWNPTLADKGAPGLTPETIRAAEVNFAREIYLARPQDVEVARNRIILGFTKAARGTGRIPLVNEVAAELSIRAERRELFASQFFGEGLVFENLEALKNAAKLKSPRAFNNVVDTTFFNQERVDRMLEAIRTRKRLIVTTAVAGAPVNQAFLDSLLKYAELRDAEILVFPANYQTTDLDPKLLDHPRIHIIMNTVHLTPDFVLNNIRAPGKFMHPLQGLDVRWARGQSAVVPSPKMVMQVVPTKDNAIRPHALFSTGAITNPNYRGRYYHNFRTDDLATEDHVMGALVLERLDQDKFFPELGQLTGEYAARHIEFIPDQRGFMDLNLFFTGSGARATQIKAVVPGDIHVGDTDDSILSEFLDHVLSANPEYLVLHDFLNGHSISHHDAGKSIGSSARARNGRFDLAVELNQMNRVLEALLTKKPNLTVVMVHSNHNDWLPQWLNKGEYPKDALNAPIGDRLAFQMRNGVPPLKEAILNGVPGRDDRSYLVTPIAKALQRRIRFVDAGESFRVGSEGSTVELGLHGHAGANGSKGGGVRGMRRAHGRVVFGHTHTQARYGKIVNTGTFTPPTLSYSKDGFSNWVRGLAIVGPNGEIQVLNFASNQWFARHDAPMVRGDRVVFPKPPGTADASAASDGFFWPGYPFAVENNLPEQTSDAAVAAPEVEEGEE